MKPLRNICDAKEQGLGAVLQQCEENKWKPNPYACKFLKDFFCISSIIELGFLTVIRPVERF